MNVDVRPSALVWLDAIRSPRACLAWSLADWERVIRLARRLRLLGRLAHGIEQAGLTTAVPAVVSRHLMAELRFSRWRTMALRWSAERVATALQGAPYPVVLLKGAAYLAQDLRIANGRLPSDLDILVPKANIDDAQARLQHSGWSEVVLDEHDRRYYHEWSHEVPPMRHPLHGMELDLHHNILPPVGRHRVDAGVLLAFAQPSLWSSWHVLDPIDQVLHSAAHLFFDSEAIDRLRDLVDLDGLLRHFGAKPGFWDALSERAEELRLSEPLALAIHFCATWIDTPVPRASRRRIEALGPSTARRAWLHPMMASILTPTEPDEVPRLSQHLSAQLMLARYHLGRMPLHLLIPHLWHKARKQKVVDVQAPEPGIDDAAR